MLQSRVMVEKGNLGREDNEENGIGPKIKDFKSVIEGSQKNKKQQQKKIKT